MTKKYEDHELTLSTLLAIDTIALRAATEVMGVLNKPYLHESQLKARIQCAVAETINTAVRETLREKQEADKENAAAASWEIRAEDLEISTYIRPGRGSWSNEGAVGVTLTHKPTGLTVSHHEINDVHRNRNYAMKELQRKLAKCQAWLSRQTQSSKEHD